MPRLTLPKTKRGRILLWTVIVLCSLGLLAVLAVGVINGIVVGSTEERIVSLDEAASLEDVDYILVLGAGVKADGTPSDMLHDRVLTACEVMTLSSDAMLLMSGDNQRPDYDEVSAMVTLAVELGADEANIETDRLGLSTYESIRRACELYGVERMVIVTQEYHLYRALYIAEQMGIDAYGVSADVRSYRGQLLRDVREVAARCKDFLVFLFD
ncbi:MAG: YdcF family protein [Clostridia bacterium]|nr:YdcF family protein [Clostridia bacterium]